MDVCFFLDLQPREGAATKRVVVLTSIPILTTMNNRRTRLCIVHISIGVEVVKLVRVRAYKRVRNGKIERVRSHYRRY